MRRRLAALARLLLLLQLAPSSAQDTDGPPVIVEHPLDVIVSKGSPATLNCAAKPASAEITWYKDGQPVTTNKELVNSHRIVLNTGALFLLSVNSGKNGKAADAGSYYCVARNEHGEAQSREGTLKIAMLRDDFRTRPRPVQALSGDKAVLECSPPRGFPDPVVTWRKDEKELRIQDDERFKLHPDGNLIIEPVQNSDSGAYVCVATNMVGERISNPARLSVYEKPMFLQEPKDVTVDVGASVLFDCRVSGEPQPQISWKKAASQMPVARAYIAKDNRGLRIDRVQVSDEGEYICHARNPAGSIEASARLRVQAPPAFTHRPADGAARPGDRVVFECRAAGQPTPALFWSREGQQHLLFPGHVSSDGRVRVGADGQLSIDDVKVADAGGYVCAAMNSAGSSIAKATLAVDGKTVDVRAPPIIEHGPANQTIAVDSSAILPCQAAAVSPFPDAAAAAPPPRITWLRNGELVDTAGDSRISQHSGGSLHIAELRKSDSGLFTCRASNEDGESTWTASLTVEEHTNPKALFFRMPDPSTFPSVPGQPTPSNISHDSLDLSWTAPERNGASPVTGYVLQYYSPEESQTWFNVHDYVSGTLHHVRYLKPSHTYLFVVRAENEKGIGAPSLPSTSVVTKPAPVSGNRGDGSESAASSADDEASRRARLTSEQLIKLEEVKTINSTAVRLFWKRKRAEEDLIQGYYVKWRGPNAETPLVNVSGAASESAVVNGLLPFTNYEFFVIPYSGVIQGTPSNSMDALTAEAPPSLPPADVHVRMLNLTTLRISWRAPPAEGMNGILRGFQIVILGKGTKFNRNITTNERAASVTLFHLSPGMTYKIKVAARTAAGIGVAHGTDVIDMTPETLEKHTSMESWTSSLLHRGWFVVGLLVFFWLLLMVGCIAFFIRRKKSSSCQSSDRMAPFIKINDGSMAAPPWGEPAYHTAARLPLPPSGTLHRPPGAIGNGIGGGGAPLYSMTPNHHDFYNPYESELGGTLHRPGSEPHYHYAQVTNGGTMSTFYGNQYQDDPSPYATTTLVAAAAQQQQQQTQSTQPAWLSDHMLRGPALPKNPVPSGPPPRFADHGTGRRSRSSRGSDYRGVGGNQNGSNSDSPPHTDISYIQSSDGTGGSTNGRFHAGTLGDTDGSRRRTPPKHNLIDLIPPPPPGAPPPSGAALEEYYESARSLGLDDQPIKSTRPTSRNRNTTRPQRGNRDDESQRSSLMDEEKARVAAGRAACSGGGADSSEADEENSDADGSSSAPVRRSIRPMQPCMGVSASTLTQSSYDNRASTGRFKSMQRSVRNE